MNNNFGCLLIVYCALMIAVVFVCLGAGAFLVAIG